jgi:hypothetical protein
MYNLLIVWKDSVFNKTKYSRPHRSSEIRFARFSKRLLDELDLQLICREKQECECGWCKVNYTRGRRRVMNLSSANIWVSCGSFHFDAFTFYGEFTLDPPWFAIDRSLASRAALSFPSGQTQKSKKGISS